VDPDTLVREVTGRTPDRGQDRTLSEDASGRLFDRLAGPDGLTATASTSLAHISWSPSALAWPGSDVWTWRSWRTGS
jgi:hypothetical protein